MVELEEKIVDGKYMIRKKFFIPESEIKRDYRDGHEKYSSNFLFPGDWEDAKNDESSFDAE